jgi:uncharacterized Zn finger protein (UPF0148 family)
VKDEYSKKVEMICPVCGGKTFEYDSAIADGPVKCISCKREFSREALVDSNQENMAIHTDELKSEVMEDVAKEMKEMLKKTFGNDKNFTVK